MSETMAATAPARTRETGQKPLPHLRCTPTGQVRWPVLVCVLGDFRVLKGDQPVAVRGGKARALLCRLALDYSRGVPRDALLEMLWPASDTTLASQSLNSLIYGLHRLLGSGLGGATPVRQTAGRYRLNAEAGVGVDAAWFDALANAGDQQARAGDSAASTASYGDAIQVYRGDLCAGTDVRAVVERERLRARYLALLAVLADYHFSRGDYSACLDHASRLLASDPCREDAHRLVMRCYVRRGERAQALRQFRLCTDILRTEFDAVPERATMALHDLVRLSPGSV